MNGHDEDHPMRWCSDCGRWIEEPCEHEVCETCCMPLPCACPDKGRALATEAAPAMPDDVRAKFRRDVLSLLRASWNTGDIADWAVGAKSGFGRYWNSREHALQEANKICREINSVRRTAHRNVSRVFRAHGL
jgi:hypothetical protein